MANKSSSGANSMEYSSDMLDELLAKVHSGKKLKAVELSLVTEILLKIEFQDIGRKLSSDDIYLLLSALGKESDKLDEKLFERFFDLEDSTTASLVAKTLCQSPEGRENYLEKLLSLALGSTWDVDGDVQQEAIELLGLFIRDENSRCLWSDRAKKVCACLIELFQDEKSSREIQMWSYTALLLAAGFPDEELPSRYAILDFNPGSKQIRWDVLSQIADQLSS